MGIALPHTWDRGFYFSVSCFTFFYSFPTRTKQLHLSPYHGRIEACQQILWERTNRQINKKKKLQLALFFGLDCAKIDASLPENTSRM